MASESPKSGGFSIRQFFHWALDFTEPVVEWGIRLCGWSAILFVFAIFFFVFREAAPTLWGDPAATTAIVAGLNNDLEFTTREHTREWNGTKILVATSDSADITFQLDKKAKTLTIGCESGATTANDVIAAFAQDPLNEQLTVQLTPTDDGRHDEDADAVESESTPNDGSGAMRPSEEPVGKLRHGSPPLNLTEFFTSPNWRPDSEVKPQYGILALMVGTLAVTVLAMVIAVPLGLGAAVYVAEFAGPRMKETLKVVIELLAAIPSVVWGFVGYMVLGPIIIWATGAPVGINILNGGIILAMMSVPIIVSVSEDSLRAVPDSYREAAIALGASRWELVYRVLFPAAKNGLLAAVLLGVGRGIGETMAVLMATGHAIQIPHSIVDPVRTLTATIAAELGETVAGDDHYRVLFVIGIVLFTVAFIVNLTADLVVKGIRGESHD